MLVMFSSCELRYVRVNFLVGIFHVDLANENI